MPKENVLQLVNDDIDGLSVDDAINYMEDLLSDLEATLGGLRDDKKREEDK